MQQKCKVIAVANQKGGVGKTTTTEHLGIGLAKTGKKVLLVDLNPQANLTACLAWLNVDALEATVSDVIEASIRKKLPFFSAASSLSLNHNSLISFYIAIISGKKRNADLSFVSYDTYHKRHLGFQKKQYSKYRTERCHAWCQTAGLYSTCFAKLSSWLI